MLVKIRLARGGCKHQPHYRVVVIPSSKARDGQAIDIIGHYHPTVHNDQRVVIDRALFEKYVANGAQPSETVARLAAGLGIEVAKKFIPRHNRVATMHDKNNNKKELKAS